jgi:hypothetical protein
MGIISGPSGVKGKFATRARREHVIANYPLSAREQDGACAHGLPRIAPPFTATRLGKGISTFDILQWSYY